MAYHRTIDRRAGMTLVEMMVAMSIGSAVIAAMLTMFVWFGRSYNNTSLQRVASQRSNLALERMVYGVGTNIGLRAAKASTVIITNNAAGWKVSYTNLWFQYTVATKRIADQSGKTIATNVFASTVVPTSKTNGCDFSITVVEAGGGRLVTNTMVTFVQFRN